MFQQHFVLVVKISRKNLLKKYKTTQRWKRSYECLTETPSYCGYYRSNFLFQSGFSQKDDEEKFDHHSEKFAEKKAFSFLFCRCCLHLSCQISIESVRNIFISSLTYLLQCCICSIL